MGRARLADTGRSLRQRPTPRAQGPRCACLRALCFHFRHAQLAAGGALAWHRQERGGSKGGRFRRSGCRRRGALLHKPAGSCWQAGEGAGPGRRARCPAIATLGRAAGAAFTCYDLPQQHSVAAAREIGAGTAVTAGAFNQNQFPIINQPTDQSSNTGCVGRSCTSTNRVIAPPPHTTSTAQHRQHVCTRRLAASPAHSHTRSRCWLASQFPQTFTPILM